MSSIDPALLPTLVGTGFGLTELGLLLERRSGTASAATDRGSLGRIWIVVGIAIALSIVASVRFPQATSPALGELRWAGVLVFLLGLALRGYSIFYLGRFFTVDVRIVADQRVIDTGPYRLVRHPSYSGSLLEFLGLALTFGNWLSMLVLFVPACAVFIHRIRIEEEALCQGLGEAYRRYMARTHRLIPGVY
jgi:protein-S-isoprenylcysteine O-methyltransferase